MEDQRPKPNRIAPASSLEQKEKMAQFFELMRDPEFKSLAANIGKTKPKGYSKFSNTPYYKRSYAEQLLPVLDIILADQKDKLLSYADFEGKKQESCRAQIVQAWQFITDFMDDDKEKPEKYATLRSLFEVVAGTRGIEIRSKLGSRNQPKAFTPVDLDEGAWRKELDDFLEAEGNENKPLVITDIRLTQEEVNELRSELALDSLITDISTTKITVVKLGAAERKEFEG